jgi:hypothetical protein
MSSQRAWVSKSSLKNGVYTSFGEAAPNVVEKPFQFFLLRPPQWPEQRFPPGYRL